MIAIYETSRPFTWTLTGDWRLLVYTWPRETISLVDTESQRLTARVLSAGSGVARFLSPMLSGLMDFDVELSATGSARLADEFAELTITAAMEAARLSDPDAHSTEQLQKIQLYIEAHLDDPGLTPQSIAQAFFISTRTLHRMFAKQGTTVACWMRLRRLEGPPRDAVLGVARSVAHRDRVALRLHRPCRLQPGVRRAVRRQPEPLPGGVELSRRKPAEADQDD